jgi:putative ABC transport system permease protein
MTPSLRDALDEARQSLLSHRLRATLSALGIICGIATIVTAVAIGQGARDAALAEIGTLGIDNIFVNAASGANVDPARTPAPILTIADAEALDRSVPGVRAWSAARIWRGDVTGPAATTPGTVIGVTESWSSITGLSVERGRWLVHADLRDRRRVAVVGAHLARQLFSGRRTADEEVRIAGTWFRVVGELRARGQVSSAMQSADSDTSLFVPFGAMDIALGAGDAPDRASALAFRLIDGSAVARGATFLPAVLQRRQVDRAAYDLVVPRELLQARLRARRTLDAVLLAIGSLALVISGIGIMNIMLASVAERTQEIGVRRAFGARREAVVIQFALEAILLCAAGGAIGLVLGWLSSALVGALAGWPITLSPAAALLSLAIALVIGLTFGVYPARRAASIDPAMALRAP